MPRQRLRIGALLFKHRDIRVRGVAAATGAPSQAFAGEGLVRRAVDDGEGQAQVMGQSGERLALLPPEKSRVHHHGEAPAQQPHRHVAQVLVGHFTGGGSVEIG